MNQEPVAWAGAFQAVMSAVLAVLIAFNAWNPTPDQIGAIFGVYVAVIAFFTVLVRSKVTPTP